MFEIPNIVWDSFIDVTPSLSGASTAVSASLTRAAQPHAISCNVIIHKPKPGNDVGLFHTCIYFLPPEIDDLVNFIRLLDVYVSRMFFLCYFLFINNTLDPWSEGARFRRNKIAMSIICIFKLQKKLSQETLKLLIFK